MKIFKFFLIITLLFPINLIGKEYSEMSNLELKNEFRNISMNKSSSFRNSSYSSSGSNFNSEMYSLITIGGICLVVNSVNFIGWFNNGYIWNGGKAGDIEDPYDFPWSFNIGCATAATGVVLFHFLYEK